MMSSKEKADELIRFYSSAGKENSIKYAIKVCVEVLGFMGADRGHEYWSRVLYDLRHRK